MEQRIEYLLRQYEKNNCSREELEELFSFINSLRASNPSVKKAIKNIYNDIRKNHPSFTYVDENGNLVLTEPEEEHPATTSEKTPVTGKAKWKLLLVVITSCIAGLIALVWIVRQNLSVVDYIQTPVAETPKKKYATKAQQGSLFLPDSTEIWLNVASSIEVPEKPVKNKREIVLKGEGFFTSKSTTDIPFAIQCGNITITANAKAFNIKAYPKDKHLTVNAVDGKIRISKGDALMGILSGGQSIKLNKADENISRKAIPAEKAATWRQGNMIFEEEFLIDIISDIERVYSVNITLTDTDFERMRVTFSYSKNDSITQVLENLCSITNTQLDGENGDFFIL